MHEKRTYVKLVKSWTWRWEVKGPKYTGTLERNLKFSGLLKKAKMMKCSKHTFETIYISLTTFQKTASAIRCSPSHATTH